MKHDVALFGCGRLSHLTQPLPQPLLWQAELLQCLVCHTIPHLTASLHKAS